MMWETVVHYLSRIGGASPKDCLRHVMRRCMKDDLAQHFCLTGRKGKLPFLGPRLLEVITDAMLRTFPDITEAAFKSQVSDWLRYAPSRLKKRTATT
ncbi:uncharacterized protein LOC135393176 isoform X2 [Ornithodoros turicata]|uniref:uncharacterized protein LOC135393176 isoform X2 n=1 Tax=Ornithodoros turicata TaxID=34597 RepID=UPI003138F412